VDVLASRILLHPSDLERSLRFYGETLGLAVFREWGGGSNRGVVFFLGAGLLEVSRSSTEPPSGAVGLLLQVRDVHREWRRLAAADVVIEEEPKRKLWGLIEMVARDPDGLAIVIVEVPSGHAQRRAA
jgi:catechol 2,3-dioxygenase-like lactoylglutathione lyase family enzyme